MKLEIHERVVIMSILPSAGNIVTLRLVEEMKRTIGFTESEIKEFELKANAETHNVTWNPSKAHAVSMELGDAARGVIAGELRRLDDAKKLEPIHMSLWEKFVEGKEEYVKVKEVQ